MAVITVTNKVNWTITIGTTSIPTGQSAAVTGVSLNQLMTLRQGGIIDFTTDGPIDSYGGPFNRTYSASVVITPAVGATDLLTITGSDTATINITRMYVAGSQTTTGMVDLRLERRAAANTGGTFAVVPAVQHDTSDPVPTAVLRAYSANPTTVGAAVPAGSALRRALFPFTALAGSIVPSTPWVFGDAAKSVVLRGSGQSVAVSMSGSVTMLGGSITLTVEWFEA